MLDTLRSAARVFAPPGRRSRWLVVVAMAVALAAAETATAFLVFRVLEVATSDSNITIVELPLGISVSVTTLVALAAVGFVLRGMLALGTTFIQSRVVQSAAADLSSTIHARYIAAPYLFHLQRSSSESIRTILWSVDEATTSVVGPSIAILTQGLVSVTLLGLLIAVAPTLTFVAVAVLGLTMLVALRLVQPRLEVLGARSEATMGRLLGSLKASLDSIRDIKAYGAEDFFDRRFSSDRHRLAGIRLRWQVLDQLPRLALEIVVVVGLLAVIGLTLAGDAFDSLVPTLGTFGYATLRIMPSATRLVASFNRLRFGRQAMANVETDLEVSDSLEHTTTSSPAGGALFEDRLALEGVWFTYPGADQAALRGVDLTIERGQMVAIAGGSGSGKSTLIDVLLGLLPPSQGVVAADGAVPDRALWRSRVGVVSQSVVLFDASVRENIAFGMHPEPDDERVRWALGVAQLGSWLDGLPSGLDTTVGEGGKLVSGGERQRIAIARSLYRRPELLVLDEATSALDGATEVSLLAALRAQVGMTTVVVSHRVAPLEAADIVVMMREGVIALHGSYGSLVSSHAEFRELVGRADDHPTE